MTSESAISQCLFIVSARCLIAVHLWYLRNPAMHNLTWPSVFLLHA